MSSTWSTIRLAISLVYSSGRRLLLLILASTIVTSIAIAAQLLVGRTLLDLLADGGVDAADLAPYLAALGALLVVSALSQAVTGELRLPLGERVHRRTMNEILDVATEVELEEYEQSDFHDRLQRARAAAGSQSSAVVFGLVTIVSTLVVATGVVAVLLTVAPILVPIAVLGYLPISYVNVRNNRARYEMERGLTEVQRERIYLEFVLTDRAEAKEIRSYDVATTLRRWHSEFWDIRLSQLRALVRRRLALTTVGTVVATGMLIATLSFALVLAARGSISIGDAAVAIVGLQQLSSRLQSAGAAFTGVHEGVTFLRDFEQFRASLPKIRAQRATGIPPSPPVLLTVDGVSYRYPGSPTEALRSVSFELRRGQIMAIVGANGSGKSTLAKLLCDLLPPSSGMIAWDGVDLAGCDPRLVRRQIAPVFQDFARYMFTIRRAIGLGDARRLDDIDAIQRAAGQAGVDEVVDIRGDGLDVRLGKMFSGGTDISIGQWQRLAIARALFRDAPVVVLDEPSASLDPRAEADLFDLLQTLCHDRIVVFVSHRFATVRSADVVMVLDQGDVVEIGSHDDLIAAGRLYHDLFHLQADRYGFTH
jgi:ATP-binding cassette subfamily B protein